VAGERKVTDPAENRTPVIQPIFNHVTEYAHDFSEVAK